jgi:hypothetical protein
MDATTTITITTSRCFPWAHHGIFNAVKNERSRQRMAFLRYKKRLALCCVNGEAPLTTSAGRRVEINIVSADIVKRVTLTKKNHRIIRCYEDPRVVVNWKRIVARLELE